MDDDAYYILVRSKKRKKERPAKNKKFELSSAIRISLFSGSSVGSNSEVVVTSRR